MLDEPSGMLEALSSPSPTKGNIGNFCKCGSLKGVFTQDEEYKDVALILRKIYIYTFLKLHLLHFSLENACWSSVHSVQEW